MTVRTATALSDAEQERRRSWFHHRFAHDIVFNQRCGVQIPEWSPDHVRYLLPFAEGLTSADGYVHGGVISAIIDTVGSGAVMAGHDFRFGSRIVTLSLSVQFFAAAHEEDLSFEGRCTQRGRRTSFADVLVTGVTSGRKVAGGQGTFQVSGERPGTPWSAERGQGSESGNGGSA